MVYLQNSRAQLTGEDSLAAPNSPITYTVLLHWTKSNNRNRQERLLFCRFQIYKKNICQNKCIHVWIRAIRDKKMHWIQWQFTSLSCKKKNSSKKYSNYYCKINISSATLWEKNDTSCLPLLSTLRCGGESPQQFQQPSNESELEKPQEQHLVIKILRYRQCI